MLVIKLQHSIFGTRILQKDGKISRARRIYTQNSFLVISVTTTNDVSISRFNGGIFSSKEKTDQIIMHNLKKP